jgi:hypothetical protein
MLYGIALGRLCMPVEYIRQLPAALAGKHLIGIATTVEDLMVAQARAARLARPINTYTRITPHGTLHGIYRR